MRRREKGRERERKGSVLFFCFRLAATLIAVNKTVSFFCRTPNLVLWERAGAHARESRALI